MPTCATCAVGREPSESRSNGQAALVLLMMRYGEPLPLSPSAGLDLASREIGTPRSMLTPYLEQPDAHRQPSALRLVATAAVAARQALARRPDVLARAERVARFIEGFESPYDLELLETVHRLARELPDVAASPERAVTEILTRFGPTRRYLQPHHVRNAWQCLHEHGWLPHPFPAIPPMPC